MIHLTTKTVGITVAFMLFGAAGTAFGQTYDPMRPGQPVPASPQTAAEVAPNPEFDNLPDAPGVEDTYYMCTACHSTAIIKQQRLSDARWDYLWQWMIEDQGMADPGEELKKTILDYLKQHFSSQR